MSEKASKGYDPTQARMVGNILAGNQAFQEALSHGSFDYAEQLTKNATQAVTYAIKLQRKAWKNEEKD